MGEERIINGSKQKKFIRNRKRPPLPQSSRNPVAVVERLNQAKIRSANMGNFSSIYEAFLKN
jgi:hypothetical protein